LIFIVVIAKIMKKGSEKTVISLESLYKSFYFFVQILQKRLDVFGESLWHLLKKSIISLFLFGKPFHS